MSQESKCSGIPSSEIDKYFAEQERVAKIPPIELTPERLDAIKELKKAIAEATIDTIMNEDGVLTGNPRNQTPKKLNRRSKPR